MYGDDYPFYPSRFLLLRAPAVKINLFTPGKMGLNNVQKIHDGLGKPADGLPAVHIAGTNGKVKRGQLVEHASHAVANLVHSTTHVFTLKLAR